MEWFGRAAAPPARERTRATVCARLFDHQLSILGGPLRVTVRRTRDEYMFSGMPPVAAGSEPCRHLRSAPLAEISVFIQLDGLASRELLGRN